MRLWRLILITRARMKALEKKWFLKGEKKAYSDMRRYLEQAHLIDSGGKVIRLPGDRFL